jgi:predicted ATPase
MFKHALVQDAAYSALSDRRRRALHARIAQVLEQHFPDIVETQPELLAHHYEQASELRKAAACLASAGERSLFYSAIAEAMAHIHRALGLLSGLPDNDEHLRLELKLQLLLYRSFVASRGHSARESEAALSRARELCEALDDQKQLPFILYGQWSSAWSRAAHLTAAEHGRAILKWAAREGSADGEAYGHFTLGVCLLWAGALEEAREHLEKAVTHGRVELPGAHLVDWGEGLPFVVALLLLGSSLFLLGMPEAARAAADRASAAEQGITQPYSRTIMLAVKCRTLLIRGDTPALLSTATELMELTTAQGHMHFRANSMVFRGWALTRSGDIVQGRDLARQGVAECRALGFLTWLSPFLAMLAECHMKAGDNSAALEALDAAEGAIRQFDERFWEAELHRLFGELSAADGKPAQAEERFTKAIAVARDQQARLLELRAATDLASLWRKQGRRAKARELLMPRYTWFGDNLNCAEVQRAKALLDTLG